MVTKNFTINLETRRTVGTATPIVVEGDTGNVFKIILTDEGTPIDLTDCRVVAIFANNAGTFAQDSELENGGITIGGDDDNEITLNLFSGSYSKGTNTCQIQIYSGVDFSTLITTADFTFEARAPLLNDNTITSDNNFPVLVELLDRVEALADREQADWTEDDDSLGTFIKNKPVVGTDFQGATQSLIAETTLADDDTVPFYDLSETAHRKSTWANIVSKIRTAFFGTSSGLLKANGSGVISAATENTDYAAVTHASRHAVGATDPTTARFTATFSADDWNATDFIQAKTDVSGGSVTITPATFKTAVSNTEGTYVFTYATATSEWKLGGAAKTLADYGITLTGSPADTDTITAQYKVCHVQTVSVTGVTSNMVMKVDLSLSDDDLVDDRLAQIEAFSLVGRVDSATGGITLTCYDGAPEVDFTIQTEVAL